MAGFRFSNKSMVTPSITPGTSLHWNLGETSKPVATGTVFIDSSANGILDSGEKGLAKVRVFIDKNNNGICDAGETSVLTDSAGRFCFSSLAAGKYVLRVVAAKAHPVVAPRGGVFSFKLIAGQAASVNFALHA